MEPDIKFPYIPQGWTQLLEDPNPDTVLKVTFALKHTEAAQNTLHNRLMEISDPRHADYGKWLSIEQITEIMAPAQANIDIVTNYLQSHGVQSEVFVTRDMVIANISIATLESMLQTKFRSYERKGLTVFRVDRAYRLPLEVAQVVDIVDPLIRFPPHNPIQSTRVESGAVGNWSDQCGAKCHGQITPWVIRQQYGMDAASSPSANSSVAVAEFQGQQFDYADLNSFADSCTLKQYQVNVVGTNDEKHCNLYAEACVESLLDIEYLASLTQPIPISDYYLSTYSLLDWIQVVNADKNAPWVHSVSYGNDEVQQTSVAYMQQVNTQFMQVTSRGITILFASGDQGVWGRSGTSTGQFNPDFPAASPYILAVGGSDLSGTNIGPETCCTDSGGGFSNTFPRPDWQNAAVTNYLSKANLPAQALYNASGRGYPDVSAIFGLNIPYCIVADGKYLGVAGTSASSPVAASIFGLLNDIRLKKGQATLGFANPWIYQTASAHPEAFNDITTGKNNAGKSAGFEAIAGWDPCTGVGTLKYNILKTLV
jgi:tripeptidyl-peptidase-1